MIAVFIILWPCYLRFLNLLCKKEFKINHSVIYTSFRCSDGNTRIFLSFQIGVLEDQYSALGILCAVLLFPIGILCCLATKTRRCSNCGAYFD
ncbi:hypothetical protein J437_LFUL009064 [Ladona fulva]|uniref:Membrane protein BRI3 n=1 Tax=Ladona fulva TaxID=123851 RepID=A0A8K0K8S9_LADFU|nr:hypothetical protein J437_LFUL009064 [Ladona fulva]